jgi:hypothetical protein
MGSRSKLLDRKSKKSKALDNFIAFGSRKKVFWSITIATIILTIIGIPVIFMDKSGTKDFLIKLIIMLWLFKIIYIGIYLDKNTRRKKENKIKKKLKKYFKWK